MPASAIPDAALDGRLGIVGLTGSGKSNVAKVGVERLLGQGRRVCVVDLLDGWWGLRVQRDGRTPAYPVAIFGGRHGDLPLNEHAGAIIGAAVAASEQSTVVVLSELDDDAARRRFAASFFTALHKHNRAPLHLVIDEADFYCPQNVVKEGPGALLLNRVKEIAARGRMRGFRAWLLTQRPAKLHKDALSQCDTLIAMQLTASQDRNAIKAWIGDQADIEVGKAILATLPKMKRGQGVLWSPRLDILRPQDFPLAATYDSSRTPEYGSDADDVALASLDLSALRDRMQAVEQEAKQNDPRLLRAEIAALKKKMAEAVAHSVVPDPAALENARRQGEEVAWAGIAAWLRSLDATAIHTLVADAEDRVTAARQRVEGLLATITQGPPRKEPAHAAPQTRHVPPQAIAPTARRVVETHRAAASAREVLAKAERLILTALAQYPRGRTKTQVAVLTGYAHSGGAFNNSLGSLRTRGWITRGHPIEITADGLEALGAYEPLPHGRALLDHWITQLGKAEKKILEALCDAYPRALSKQQVANLAGYEATGGSFNNALGRLRTLELINGRGDLKASEDLFG